MRLTILGPIPYDDVVNMTHSERKILVDVVRERSDAQNPNKQKQVKMTPGEINGPMNAPQSRTEQR